MKYNTFKEWIVKKEGVVNVMGQIGGTQVGQPNQSTQQPQQLQQQQNPNMPKNQVDQNVLKKAVKTLSPEIAKFRNGLASKVGPEIAKAVMPVNPNEIN